jgi:hypothetical protein
MDKQHLADLLSEIKDEYGGVRTPVTHDAQPWFDMIEFIDGGILKVNPPKVSKIRSAYKNSFECKRHFVVQSVTISFKGKKRNFSDVNSFSVAKTVERYRWVNGVQTIVKVHEIPSALIWGFNLNYFYQVETADRVAKYLIENCPNFAKFNGLFVEAWNNTKLNAESIVDKHFAVVGDDSRAKLQTNLAKFLANSKLLGMDNYAILTLLHQSYQSLVDFSIFARDNRHASQMATIEDVETAQDLAKCFQVNES